MSNLITRTYTFTDGTTAYGSQVDSEIANIVNTLNSLDQGNTTWTNVKVTTLSVQGDVNAGGHKITNLGTPSTSGDALAYGGTLNGSTLTLSSTVNSNVSFDNTNTHGIVGTTTNNSATSGNVGEYISASFSASVLGANAYSDATSISLTAGDWDISAIGYASATFTVFVIGISTTSGNSSTGLTAGDNLAEFDQASGATSSVVTLSIPSYRVSISSTTTHYFKIKCVGTTPSTYGRISARRVR